MKSKYIDQQNFLQWLIFIFEKNYFVNIPINFQLIMDMSHPEKVILNTIFKRKMYFIFVDLCLYFETTRRFQ